MITAEMVKTWPVEKLAGFLQAYIVEWSYQGSDFTPEDCLVLTELLNRLREMESKQCG